MAETLSRRSLFVAAAALAGGGAAPAKYDKKQAAYRDKPNGIAMCATCSFFQAPKSCAVVTGDVSPKGWCKLYAPLD